MPSLHGRSFHVGYRKEFHVSKEAVRQWMLKFGEVLATRNLPTLKERDVLLLNETKIKRIGKMVSYRLP